MPVFYDEITLPTNSNIAFYDITEKVMEIIKKWDLKNGIVTIFSMHTTCCIRVNENEPKLMKDMENFLEKWAPKNANYGHDINPVDGRKNAHAHLKSLLLNTSESIPIQNGKMKMGSWQAIFFVELDGPRNERKMVLQGVGE